MKHLLLLCFFSLIMLISARAQESQWYVNVGVGPINYLGDLKDKFTPSQMQFNAMTGLTYQRSHFSANLSFTVGSLKANDSKNGDKWRYRNLSFQTSLFEVATSLQYDFINIDQSDENNIAEVNPRKLTPFVFGGIALVHFNPYTYDLSGKKVYLQPLGTEGQASPYSLWSAAFPIGVGVKYALTHNTMISAEFNFRKTLTDYIDDVSQHHYVDTVQLLATHGQEAASLSYRADEIPDNKYQFWGYRGNPNKKDAYYSILIKLSYQFTHRPKFYYGY